VFKKKNYIIDIDGCICEKVSNEEPEKMATAKEIPGAKEWVNKQYDCGHNISFFTARTEEHRQVTIAWLKEHGFKYNNIIFGKPRGGNYWYIDDLHIRGITFRGKFGKLVKRDHKIVVFED
jgi:uncharacterized HAD superfamily protein